MIRSLINLISYKAPLVSILFEKWWKTFSFAYIRVLYSFNLYFHSLARVQGTDKLSVTLQPQIYSFLHLARYAICTPSVFTVWFRECLEFSKTNFEVARRFGVFQTEFNVSTAIRQNGEIFFDLCLNPKVVFHS